MKNIIITITILIGFVLSTSACTKKEKSVESFSLGLVTDIGGIADRSFNQSAWEGVLQFVKENDIDETDYTYIQSTTHADYIPNLSTLADADTSLIIAAGFTFTDAITEVAQNFPKTQFLIVDTEVSLPNVASAVFNEEQGSFLVGIIAGLQAQAEGKRKVGFIGGMSFDVIHRFEAGFEKGVQTVAPELELVVEYASDFSSPQVGQALAAKMYDAGVHIIFHAAATTGNGVIKEAKDNALAGKKVWVIGVDKDQYKEGLYTNNSSVVLTSMVKRVDVATHDVAALAHEGQFPANQTLTFSLANDGVGIPEKNPNVRAEFLEVVDEYKAKVISGEIQVPQVPSRLRD